MRRWHLLHSGKAIKVLQSVPQNVTFWKMRRGHLLHSKLMEYLKTCMCVDKQGRT